MATAAGIIIGDEILSGKVRDENAHLLIRTLRAAGVELERIVTVRDDPTAIAEEVAHCTRRYDYVITSGGVGPTHDDRTMLGVATAFGRAIARDAELERRIRDHWGTRINEAALKLAEVPDGARLAYAGDGLLPLVAVENVFILPGIPELFEAKLLQVRFEISGLRWVLHSVYISIDETSIAHHLSRVDDEFGSVNIGSYPTLSNARHRVRVTVESTDGALAGRALTRLLELLPEEGVVRVERDPSTAA